MTPPPSTAPTPAPAPPPTTDGLDPLLAEWLAAGEASCPQCGYDISSAPVPRCAECGAELRLRLLPADGGDSPAWAIVLGLLSLLPGMMGLLIVGATINALIRGRGLPSLGDLMRLPPRTFIAAASVIPAIAWFAMRRWFIRAEAPWRRAAIITFTAIGVMLILLVWRQFFR